MKTTTDSTYDLSLWRWTSLRSLTLTPRHSCHLFTSHTQPDSSSPKANATSVSDEETWLFCDNAGPVVHQAFTDPLSSFQQHSSRRNSIRTRQTTRISSLHHWAPRRKRVSYRSPTKRLHTRFGLASPHGQKPAQRFCSSARAKSILKSSRSTPEASRLKLAETLSSQCPVMQHKL